MAQDGSTSVARILTHCPDKYHAEMFIFPENRTAENKYYATQVKATVGKYNSLKQQDYEAAKRMMEETLKDVAATHTVCSLWRFPIYHTCF